MFVFQPPKIYLNFWYKKDNGNKKPKTLYNKGKRKTATHYERRKLFYNVTGSLKKGSERVMEKASQFFNLMYFIKEILCRF